jgi:hypothetical protein
MRLLTTGTDGMLSLPGNAESRVQIPYIPNYSFGPRGTWSIEAWVNPAGQQNSYILGRLVTYIVGEWGLLVAPGTTTDFCTIKVYREVSPYTVTAPTEIRINTWSHVVATYDSTYLKIYINGKLDLTFTWAANSGVNTTYDLTIGCTIINGTYNNIFNGKLDDVRLWNVALSATEVLSNMNNSIIDISGLVGHWRFDEHNTQYVGGSAYANKYPQSLVSSGLSCHLKSTNGIVKDSDDLISSWQDQSGLGNDFTQATPALQPKYVANVVNGYPTVKATGAQWLRSVKAMNLQHVFIVVNFHQYTQLGGLLACNATGTHNIRLDTAFTDRLRGIYGSTDSNDLSFTTKKTYVNGINCGEINYNEFVVLSVENSSNYTNVFELFCHVNYNRFLFGEIAEVVTYSRALTTDERKQNINYLLSKYNIKQRIVKDYSPIANHGVLLNKATIMRSTSPVEAPKIATSRNTATNRERMFLISNDRLNRSFVFTGNTEYATIPHAHINTTSLTIEFYVKTTATTNLVILEKGPSNMNFHAQTGNDAMQNTGKIMFGTNSYYTNKVLTGVINDGKWHHVAFTYSKTSKTLKAYTDLVLTDTRTGVSDVIANTDDWFIGSRNGLYTFNGEIAELRFWDAELSLTDLSSRATEQIKGNEANFVACFRPKAINNTINSVKSVAGLSPTVPTATLANNLKINIADIPVMYKKYIKLNRNSDHIEIPNHSKYNPIDAVSVEAWVMLQQTPDSSEATIVSKGMVPTSTTNGSYGIHISQTLSVIGKVFTSTGTSVVAESAAASIKLNQWTHVAITYDKSKLITYVNGVQVASTASTDSLSTNTLPVYIGVRGYQAHLSTQTRLNGIIANVKIWDQCVSPIQLKQSMYITNSKNTLGLVGLWELNDTFGSVVKDSSAVGNNGTLINVTTRSEYSSANWINKYVKMPSTGSAVSYVQTPDYNLINLLEDITVEMWVRLPTYPTTYATLLSKFTNDTNNEFMIRIFNSTTGQFYFGNGTQTPICTFNPSSIIPLNTWTHLAFVKDTANRQMLVYANGTLATSYTIPSNITSLKGTTNGNQQYLINLNTSSNAKYEMHVDELRVWNVAKSASDIKANYNKIVETNADNLALYYRFDNDYGTKVLDLSPYGQHGNLINNTVYEVSDNNNVLIYGPPINRT